MLPSSAVIKQNARKQLSGGWSRCIIAALMSVMALAFAVVFFETVFEIFYTYMHTSAGKISVPGFIIALAVAVVVAFLLFPLFQGVIRWYWFYGLEKERPLGELFYYYQSRRLFFGAVYLALRIIARIAALAIACYLPAVLVWSIANGTFYSLSGYSDADNPNLLLPLLYIFTALSTLLLIKLSVRYLTAPVLMVIDEKLDAPDAIALSAVIATRYKNAYFKIFFAFIGWFLLSAFGITMLYTLPFILMSYVVFCRFAINAYRTDCYTAGQAPKI